MKTVVRALLTAVLAASANTLITSPFISSFVSKYIHNNAFLSLYPLITVALVAVGGIYLGFLLLPTNTKGSIRFTHALCVASLSIGISSLVTEPLAAMWNQLGTVNEGFAFLLSLLCIWTTGYVAVWHTIHYWTSGNIKLPARLQGYLDKEETILCYIKQFALLNPFTPDYLLATDQRLIAYRPSNFGFRASIEDYNYIDIANVKIESGVFLCTVSLKERFEGNDLTFNQVVAYQAKRFSRCVTNQIQRRQMQLPGGNQSLLQNLSPAFAQKRVLLFKLANGEITGSQYDVMSEGINEFHV